MKELVEVWRQRRTPRVIVAIAALYIVLALLSRWYFRMTGLELHLSHGVVFAFGLLIGPSAAWGAALGHLGTDLLSGSFSAATSIGYLTQFVLVVSGYRLWGKFGRMSSGENPGVFTANNLLEYALVAITTAAFVAAVTAWGTLILALSPFAATVLDTLINQILSLLLIGAPTLYILSAQAGRLNLRFLTMEGADLNRQNSNQGISGVWVSILAVSWCIVGFTISILFQAVQLEPTSQVVNRVGRGIMTMLSFSGPGGLYLQILSGTVFFVSCSFFVYRD